MVVSEADIITPSVKIDKRFRQLPQGGSQADDTFSLGLFLASLPEGGGTRSVTEGVVLRSALCTLRSALK